MSQPSSHVASPALDCGRTEPATPSLEKDDVANDVATLPCSPRSSDELRPGYASVGTASSSLTRVDHLPPTTTFDANLLSTTRLVATHVGAALTLFLATTDATLVSTALPTIANDLKASQAEYSWVGVAYLLTQTAFQPLYGKLSGLVGRQAVLYTSMSIFVIGSALCGAAQSILWLIVARALSGVGAGGIVACVWTITSEIVAPSRRARWSQALSITWSCSAIAGPLLGGVFSGGASKLSWRYGFYLNIPVCLVAFLVLWISLRPVRFPRSSNTSWRALSRTFDFPGLILFVVGTFCIILGFGYSSMLGWSSPPTLSLISLGLIVLVGGGVYEMNTKRDALFSPTTFKDPTAVIILVVAFLHNVAFNAGTFYLALYYQAVDGMTPIQAGIMLLPYSLGSSLISMAVAWILDVWQAKTRNMCGHRWVIFIGLAFAALGFGLMTTLDEHSRKAPQVAFALLAGIGIGALFHAPYQVFLRVLRPDELASATGAFMLVRMTGATVGLSVAGAIFSSRLAHTAPTGFAQPGPTSSVSWTTLRGLEPPAFRAEVLSAVSASLQTVWIVCTPCLAVACVISLFSRTLSVSDDERTNSPASPPKSAMKASMEKV